MRKILLISLSIFILFCSSCKDEQPVKENNIAETQSLLKFSANGDHLLGSCLLIKRA